MRCSKIPLFKSTRYIAVTQIYTNNSHNVLFEAIVSTNNKNFNANWVLT